MALVYCAMEKKGEMKTNRVSLELSMKISPVALPESKVSRVEEHKLDYRELKSECNVGK